MAKFYIFINVRSEDSSSGMIVEVSLPCLDVPQGL
jgi:hypothetical protein